MVTHLAQVAAFADQHVAITKRDVEGRTVSEATVLDDDARVTDTTDTAARETRMVVRLLASSRAALSTTSFIEHTPRHIPFRSRVPFPFSPSRLRARGVCHDMAWHDRGFG